jgi:hypothetical protein
MRDGNFVVVKSSVHMLHLSVGIKDISEAVSGPVGWGWFNLSGVVVNISFRVRIPDIGAVERIICGSGHRRIGTGRIGSTSERGLRVSAAVCFTNHIIITIFFTFYRISAI